MTVSSATSSTSTSPSSSDTVTTTGTTNSTSIDWTTLIQSEVDAKQIGRAHV